MDNTDINITTRVLHLHNATSKTSQSAPPQKAEGAPQPPPLPEGGQESRARAREPKAEEKTK